MRRSFPAAAAWLLPGVLAIATLGIATSTNSTPASGGDPGAPASREPPAETSATRPVVLHFEIKLYVRRRGPLRRAEIDQWAGGRLLMDASRDPGGTTWSLARVLRDPWTLRWYPTLGEVKLGAAISVARPEGDPYGSLAPALSRLAREKAVAWWEGSDVVDPTPGGFPSWQTRANGFWAELHRREAGRPHDLPSDPVYPFHVLGDPAGRFRFRVGADGAVSPGSIVDRMSEPWLPNGWREWQRGLPREGYGYWDSKRPKWEPRTYPALAAALRLLAWSPGQVPDAGRSASSGGSGFVVDLDPDETFDLPAAAAGAIAALNPHFDDRVEWSGRLRMRFVLTNGRDGSRSVTGESVETNVDPRAAVLFRAWRQTRFDDVGHPPQADQVQIHAADDAGRVAVWIRVGYYRPEARREATR